MPLWSMLSLVYNDHHPVGQKCFIQLPHPQFFYFEPLMYISYRTNSQKLYCANFILLCVINLRIFFKYVKVVYCCYTVHLKSITVSILRRYICKLVFTQWLNLEIKICGNSYKGGKTVPNLFIGNIKVWQYVRKKKNSLTNEWKKMF